MDIYIIGAPLVFSVIDRYCEIYSNTDLIILLLNKYELRRKKKGKLKINWIVWRIY